MTVLRVFSFILLIAFAMSLLVSCGNANDAELDRNIFDMIIKDTSPEPDEKDSDEEGKLDNIVLEDKDKNSVDNETNILVFLISEESLSLELSHFTDLLTCIKSSSSVAVFYNISDYYKTHISYNLGELITLNDAITVYIDQTNLSCTSSDIALFEDRGTIVLDLTSVADGQTFVLSITPDGQGGLCDNCTLYLTSEKSVTSEYYRRTCEDGMVLWETMKFKIS